MPSFPSWPTMRGVPHSGFALETLPAGINEIPHSGIVAINDPTLPSRQHEVNNIKDYGFSGRIPPRGLPCDGLEKFSDSTISASFRTPRLPAHSGSPRAGCKRSRKFRRFDHRKRKQQYVDEEAQNQIVESCTTALAIVINRGRNCSIGRDNFQPADLGTGRSSLPR
jgi:hypothetical protein